MTDLAHADVVVCPHWYWPNTESTDRAIQAARQAGLPCVFFQMSDISTPANPPYGVVYRTSIFADRRTPCERAMAGHADDMLANRHGQVPVSTKQDTPSLGFCGQFGNFWLYLLFALKRRGRNIEAMNLRRRIIKTLRGCDRITTHFILRGRWWGGAIHKPDLQRRLRQEYLDNMLGTDYTLCVRGGGNYSYRFYETLSAGKIPLFVNTRCVLPFEDRIDWRKHCVIVDEREIDRAGEILADFHASVSTDRFQAMQLANRQLWEQWLSPLAFYRRALEEVCREHRDAVAKDAPAKSPTSRIG